MMKNRIYILAIVVCLLWSSFSFALSSGVISYPLRTQLVDQQKDESVSQFFGKSYRFKSELEAEEVLQFYRELMLSKGFDEIAFDENRYGVYTFTRGIITRLVLKLRSTKTGSEYDVDVYEAKDVLFLSWVKFRLPQRVSFLPKLSGLNEFAFDNKSVPGRAGISYLTKAKADKVTDFYLTQMPKLGWVVKDNLSWDGTHNLMEALSTGHPEYNRFVMKPSKRTPGLNVNVQGATLSFERNGEKCVMIINEFKDPSDELKKKRLNPDIFSKYGSTMICVEYYEKTS